MQWFGVVPYAVPYAMHVCGAFIQYLIDKVVEVVFCSTLSCTLGTTL